MMAWQKGKALWSVLKNRNQHTNVCGQRLKKKKQCSITFAGAIRYNCGNAGTTPTWCVSRKNLKLYARQCYDQVPADRPRLPQLHHYMYGTNHIATNSPEMLRLASMAHCVADFTMVSTDSKSRTIGSEASEIPRKGKRAVCF